MTKRGANLPPPVQTRLIDNPTLASFEAEINMDLANVCK